ncbi:MAG: hypothetical protein WC261_10985 [Synergistaceae bacterium]|jgi:hypothetical protein
MNIIVEVFGVKKRIRIVADTPEDAIKAAQKKLLSVARIEVENDDAVEFLKSVFGMKK